MLQHQYQPIVEIGSGVVGYEALLRMPGRDVGALLRDVAYAGPEAQRAFDRECVASAIQGARGWLEAESRLFINVTAATVHAVMDGDAWPDTQGVAVVWEIPEGRAGTDAALRIGAAQALGEVALDDLGAGDSDLRRLAAFPGAWCKLDMELVRHCDQRPGNAAIIRAVALVAKELGQRVIAEGVERVEQARALTDLGVRYAQGFLYGWPERRPGLAPVAQC